jgi:hypothetical protein
MANSKPLRRVNRSRKRVLENERALSGQRSEAAHFSRVMPHTLPERVHSLCALNRLKLLTQRASSMLVKTQHQNRRRVFDLDQTVLLTNFSNLREALAQGMCSNLKCGRSVLPGFYKLDAVAPQPSVQPRMTPSGVPPFGVISFPSNSCRIRYRDLEGRRSGDYVAHIYPSCCCKNLGAWSQRGDIQHPRRILCRHLCCR